MKPKEPNPLSEELTTALFKVIMLSQLKRAVDWQDIILLNAEILNETTNK